MERKAQKLQEYLTKSSVYDINIYGGFKYTSKMLFERQVRMDGNKIL